VSEGLFKGETYEELFALNHEIVRAFRSWDNFYYQWIWERNRGPTLILMKWFTSSQLGKAGKKSSELSRCSPSQVTCRCSSVAQKTKSWKCMAPQGSPCYT